jgi:two-component system OmpR family response regulator
VLTRAMIFETVWGFHFDPGTNLIDVHIGRLRRKIDTGEHQPLIHTVRGSGYSLAQTD